ncbi:MAG: site-specific tyrosine recombinase XerD [Acidimicrobiales bacterium]
MPAPPTGPGAERGGGATSLRARPLSVPSEEFLSWLAVERGRARNTLLAYHRDIASYEQTLLTRGRHSPADADRDDVHAHLDRLSHQRASPATLARSLSVVRGLHRFMLDEQFAVDDPTADLGSGRPPLRLPKPLTEEEMVRLLSSTSGDQPADRRDRALLEVLYGTGARISEVTGLNVADLVWDSGLLRLYGKGAKERLVPLGRLARQALADWMAPAGRGRMVPPKWRRRGDAEAVFLNVRGGRLSRQGAYGILRKRALQAGLGEKVSPHALRHSCATHMLAHGADIRVVQELLGHASVSTTQLYTKVTADHLRHAYQAAHPRAGES